MSSKQRTKNKPSSSSTAASLVGQNAGFGGFGGVATQLHQQMGSEFQLAFKKISKKDAITRSKGLEELKVLFEKNLIEKSEEEKAIITRWSNAWPILVTATEPKNRILALQTMRVLAVHLGRRLGAHLKSLYPAWLIAHFDTQKSVQLVSQQVLFDTIPENKHTEAILFCKVEILGYLQKNFGLTTQLLGASITPEEAEEKYERVISASILVLNHVVQKLSEDENTKLLPDYINVMDVKFWKFLSSKYSLIRRAMYILLETLLKAIPDVIGQNLALLSPQIIGILSETNKDIHSVMWDALLQFLKVFPITSKFQEQLFSPLFSLLRGGSLDSVTSACLLPFLGLLPVEVIANNKSFHDEFFTSLWSGLAGEYINALNSQHLISAYMECLLYVILKAKSVNAPEEVVLKLFDHFLDKFSIFLSIEKIESETLVPALAKFVFQLSKREHCAELVAIFWNSVHVEATKGFLVWSQDEQIKDTAKSALFCERLSLFLSQCSSEQSSLSQPLLQFCKKVYGTLSIVCKKELSAQLDLIAKIVSIYGLKSLASTNYHSVLPNDIFPWLEKWSVSMKKHKRLIESLFCICGTYFSSELKKVGDDGTEEAFKNWDKLLNSFNLADHSLFLKLCGTICVSSTDSSLCHHQIFDTIARDIANKLLQGSIVNYDSVRLLCFLISGIDFQAFPLISQSTLTDLCTQLQEALCKIATITTGAEAEKILSILNVVHAIVVSFRLPSSLTKTRIALLTLTFSGRVAPDKTVRKGFCDLWDDISKKVVASEIMKVDEFLDQILFSFIDQLWKDIKNGSISLKLAVSQAVEIMSSSHELEKSTSKYNRTLDKLLLPLKQLTSKNAFLATLDMDPLSSGISLPSTPTGDVLAMSDYIISIDFVVQFLLHEIDTSPKEPILEKILENRNWLITELVGVSIASEWNLSPLYVIAANEKGLDAAINSWDAIRSSLPELCEDHLFPILQEETDTSLISTAFELALNQQSIIDPLVLRALLQKMKKSRTTWFELFLTRVDLMSLPLYLLDAIFPVVVPELPSATTIMLTTDVLELIVKKGREANSKPEDLAPSLGYWSSLSESIQEVVVPKQHGSVLFILLGTLTNSAFLDKLALSMRIILARFAASLIHHFPTSVPNLDSKLWQQLWAMALSHLKQENISKDKTNWSLYCHTLQLISEMISMAKNEDFNNSKYDVVIVDGQIVRANVRYEATPSATEWGKRQDEAFKIISRHFMSVPSSYSPKQKTLLSHLAKIVVHSPEAIITSIDEYDVILYDHLMMAHSHIQFASYQILKKLIQIRNSETTPILEQTKKEQSLQSKGFDAQEEIITILPIKLRNIIENFQESKDQPNYYKFGYNLTWLLLLEYLGTKNGKEKSDISAYLRQKNILPKFLTTLFDIIDPSRSPPPSLDVYSDLAGMSAFVYRQIVSLLPSMVRVWWGDLSNRSITNKVDQYTTKHVSPVLITEELSKVQLYNQNSTTKGSNDPVVGVMSNLTPEGASFSVKACRGTANEVQATYAKDDIEATIVLTLADSHPLRAVTVSSKQRMGVNEAIWRKWLLSMTTLLLTQDGSVLDAVLLWRNSLENYFQGVELCPICYSLFHSSNFSIPTVSCKTCRSKFHGACLYKWFHTSLKNECPMCKTLFN